MFLVYLFGEIVQLRGNLWSPVLKFSHAISRRGEPLGPLVAQELPLAQLLLPALVWLAGLGAIVFLWQKDSSAYFAAPRV